MKKFRCVLLAILFTLPCSFAFAQKYANTWYFGNKAGIDFNSGTATALTNSGMNDFEGCSCISDPATGSILFYSDGLFIWNANHLVMQNGNGLMGNYSSAQSALIVPDPANSNQYYIFTAGEYYSNGSNGYHYSIVDMTLNGGLGDVTSSKNILLYSPASEKLAAVKNAAGDGFWIATHEWSGQNFVLYELTSAGLSAPVISATGQSYSGTNPIGCMKFSPDGKHIATILSGLNEAEVYDFDPATGIISNPLTLGLIAQTFPYVYGISFSPNGERLYATEENDNHIYQYDLAAPNVNASKIAVGTSTSNAMQTLQLAPDGKLYIARNGSNYLAVIDYPDSIGLACKFTDNGFYLAGKSSAYGLPNFSEEIFKSSSVPQINFAASDTDVCQKFCIDFFDSSSNNPTSWEWSFPGGTPSSSTDQNPGNICYNNPGIYDVTLVTTNSSGSDTLTLTNYITVFTTPPFPTITQNGNTLTCSNASSYQWQFNSVDIPGATNQSYTATQTGFYTVVIGDENGCVNSATVFVEITGIGDTGSEMGVLLYPNLAATEITVAVEDLHGGNFSIEVWNLMGQRLFTLTEENISRNFSHILDFTDRPSGVYLLKIKMNNFSIARKIVISR